MTDEIDSVGDVEEAIDIPLSWSRGQKRRVARTGQTEIGSAGDSQQIEIWITRRQLSLKLHHVAIKRLNWSARGARRGVNAKLHRYGNAA